MSLREDQELRRDLTLWVLQKCSDPQRALSIAARMERYVIYGQRINEQSSRRLKDPSFSEESGKSWCRPRWNQSEDLRLCQLWQDNPGVMVVASALNRTPASVYGRARRLGLLQNGKLAHISRQKPELKSSARKLPVAVSPNTADNEYVGIDSVIWFLRTRDYTVVQNGDGCYKLDEREILTPEELFKRANRVRDWLGRPAWASLLGVLDQIE
jgi:hypothetical protein